MSNPNPVQNQNQLQVKQSAAQPQQAGNANTASGSKLILPTDKTLQQATKLSLKTKKPICFYFYIDSLNGKIKISNDGEDRIIFKSEDEYTSPILNTYRSENSYIIVTENTIYILSSDTQIA